MLAENCGVEQLKFSLKKKKPGAFIYLVEFLSFNLVRISLSGSETFQGVPLQQLKTQKSSWFLLQRASSTDRSVANCLFTFPQSFPLNAYLKRQLKPQPAS